VTRALAGDPREVLKAKVVLRALLVDGRVKLCPGDDGSLWAEYSLSASPLLKTAVVTGYRGRGI
jgi:hypothetical protein